MPFGVRGAAETFQRLIDLVLAPHKCYTTAYIDDISIYTNEWEEHLDALRTVLQELRSTSLTANGEKFGLGKAQMKYLGFMVGKGCIHPLTDKIEAIGDYSPLQNGNKCGPFWDWPVIIVSLSHSLPR